MARALGVLSWAKCFVGGGPSRVGLRDVVGVVALFYALRLCEALRCLES